MTKPKPKPRKPDTRVRGLQGVARGLPTPADHRAGIDAQVAACNLPGQPCVWVRSIRLECDTYSTINAGHFLSVWQVDDGEWRVTIEVAGQEIVIAHATTPQHGMRAANAWAAGHDSSLIKLRRAMRHGASTWILDEAALAASAVNTNQQGDPTP